MSVVELPGEDRRWSDDVILRLIDGQGVVDGVAHAVTAKVDHASEALADLAALDPADLDAGSLKALVLGVERLRRQADAAAIALAEHVDVAQPFRADGWFTAKRWLKHALQLSGPEAHGRVQGARLRTRVPAWADAERAGRVGVAQYRVMASIAANPRIDDATLAVGALALLDDAIALGFDEFERLARTWEMLADPTGALEAAERNRQRRDAFIRPRRDGGWDLHAVLDDIGGAEVAEILAWYIDAEFRTDWAEAVNRLGEGQVSMADLRRSEPQRRADALVAMARAGAAAPPDAKRPVPTVNIVVDADTLAAWTDRTTTQADPAEPPADPSPESSAGPADASTGTTAAATRAAGRGRVPVIDPARYPDVICRTQRGQHLHPAHVADTTLWGLIRRVVIDSRSVIIDLGRRSRLFTGHARESVMLLETECAWTGCDQPSAWCHADHLHGWNRARGPTRPANGAPLCPRHNYLKEQGFTVTRDHHGNWHVHAPDGHEIT
jgi:hypothetical protein